MLRMIYNFIIVFFFIKDLLNLLGWGRWWLLRCGLFVVDDGWCFCWWRFVLRKVDNFWWKVGILNFLWVRFCNILKILYILLVLYYFNGIFFGCIIFFFWGGVYQYIYVYIFYSNFCNLGVMCSNFVKFVFIYNVFEMCYKYID